jgi:hypothetical protein
MNLIEATRAAKAREPFIATNVKAGQFTIVRAEPRKGRSHDVKVLAGPMPGWQAVEALERFANGGKL